MGFSQILPTGRDPQTSQLSQAQKAKENSSISSKREADEECVGRDRFIPPHQKLKLLEQRGAKKDDPLWPKKWEDSPVPAPKRDKAPPPPKKSETDKKDDPLWPKKWE